MDGEIYLDDEFDSGVPGCRGTRFVVQLQVPPEGFAQDELSHLISNDNASRSHVSQSEHASPKELPEELSVLL